MSSADVLPEGRGSTRERIAATLRDEILDGRLGPGVPLRTGVVMERLGVSNSPLREAFVQLEAEGLVEVNRNRGVVVAPLTRAGATDLIRIGSLLWEVTYGWIVPILDGEKLDALARVHTDFALSLRSGDLRSAILDGEQFGGLVLDSCWSTELVRSIEAVRPRLIRLNRMLATAAILENSEQIQLAVLEAAGSTDLTGVNAALAGYWNAVRDAVEMNPRVPA